MKKEKKAGKGKTERKKAYHDNNDNKTISLRYFFSRGG